MNLFIALGSFFPAQTGGADNSTYWHVRALAQLGYQVAVATTDSGLSAGQVPLNRWTPTKFGDVLYARTRVHYLPLRLFIMSVGRALRADVVHLNAIFYPISLLLALVCVPAGKRLVWSVHGELAPAALTDNPPVQKRFFLAIIRLLRHRVVFHVTSAVEQQYARLILGADIRTVVVPLYVELPAVYYHQPKQPYLLFLGRLHPIKALDQLLKALAQTATFRQSAYKLIVAGTGEPAYEQELRELTHQLGLTSQVEFVGYRDGEAKNKLMANAYLTLLPSHTENFSVVVVESLAQGTPVLASIYTPWQLLAEQQAGWWVDNTPAVLAETIDEALRLSPISYETCRQNARRLAVESFDITRHVGQWEAVYGNRVVETA